MEEEWRAVEVSERVLIEVVRRVEGEREKESFGGLD